MTQIFSCLCLLLFTFHPKDGYLQGVYTQITSGIYEENTKNSISPLEGLDLVKERYATNFERVYDQYTKEYYYKLPEAEFYLVYEGMDETGSAYLYHLYEYVLDEPETGLGHAVTYGWYWVNKSSGIITGGNDSVMFGENVL